MILANKFKRSVAWFLDGIILALPIIFLVEKLWDILDAESVKCLVVFLFLMITSYFALFESSKYQATPGKKLLNLYVSNLDNQKLNFKKALQRSLLFMPSLLLPITIGAGIAIGYNKLIWIYILLDSCLLIAWYIPIFFTKERMTTYDILSSSKVNYKPDSSAKLNSNI